VPCPINDVCRGGGAHLPCEPVGGKITVTHGHCDSRPMVTSAASGHHRPLTGTKLYCLVTEAHVCEQLAQGCYLKVERAEIRTRERPFESQVQRSITTTPPGQTLTRLDYQGCRGDGISVPTPTPYPYPWGSPYPRQTCQLQTIHGSYYKV